MNVEGAIAASKYGSVIPLAPPTGYRFIPSSGEVVTIDRNQPIVGFDKGSSDPEEIRRLWRRCPDAGVGLLAWTGHLLVIDVEHPDKKEGGADGFATMRALVSQLGPLRQTRTHRTKSGGKHYVYRVPEGCTLRSSQGFLRGAELSAPGVDVVTGRAALRWPPTTGYALEGQLSSCADLPPRWLEAMTDRERPPSAPRHFEAHDCIERYVSRAVELEARDLGGVQSTRNCALARAAYKLGTLSAYVGEERIVEALLGACEANGSLREHGQRTCVGTIRRCIASGAKKPRTLILD